MSKVLPEMGSLRKTGPKTVLLTILVSLMVIEVSTDLPYEGGIYYKDDRSMIIFSLNCV